jgi:hypothetical protein
MSILIKGVDMPTERESYTITVMYNGTVLDTETGMQVAEAHEVPPHGNLKDADALLKGIANDAIWKHDAMNEYDSGIRTGARTIMRSIRNAPTIVDAEE